MPLLTVAKEDASQSLMLLEKDANNSSQFYLAFVREKPGLRDHTTVHFRFDFLDIDDRF